MNIFTKTESKYTGYVNSHMPKRWKKSNLFLFLLLAITIPTTIYLTQQIQDTRQRASQSITPPIPPTAPINWSTKDVTFTASSLALTVDGTSYNFSDGQLSYATSTRPSTNRIRMTVKWTEKQSTIGFFMDFIVMPGGYMWDGIASVLVDNTKIVYDMTPTYMRADLNTSFTSSMYELTYSDASHASTLKFENLSVLPMFNRTSITPPPTSPTPTQAGGNKISGTVFIDTNNNTKMESTERRQPGTTIRLYRATAGSTSYQLISSTRTDSNGQYSFLNTTRNDSYRVQLIVPNGYSMTTTNLYTIAAPVRGSHYLGFGIRPIPSTTLTPTLACTVPNVIQNVQIEYPGCQGDVCSFSEASCSWSGPIGSVKFNYTITETGSNTVIKKGTVDGQTSKILFPVTQNKTYQCAVAGVNSCGQAGKAGVDSLLIKVDGLTPSTSPIPSGVPSQQRNNSISGRAYIDTNLNGKFDQNEKGYAKATIRLYGNANIGGIITTTETDANGMYTLSNVKPNLDYMVYLVPPAGYSFLSKDPVIVSVKTTSLTGIDFRLRSNNQ